MALVGDRPPEELRVEGGESQRLGAVDDDVVEASDDGIIMLLRRGSGEAPATSSAPADKVQQEASPRVVEVRVDEDDRLPCPEHGPTLVHGEHERRADEGGQEVVGPVAGGAVAMPIAIVPGEEATDRLLQIRLGTGTGLDESEPGRRVRQKDMAEPVAFVTAERLHMVGDVGHEPPAGVDPHLS